MDFSIIFQLRNKKFWWMDVIFYFVISLLIATVFCYVIFLVKDYFIKKDIAFETERLGKVGTNIQREHESYVINYKNKINDFSELFKNHTFASNVFPFLQDRVRPNVWFKQFNLDQTSSAVQLSGESDDLDSFSRQVSIFESEDNKKYIKSISTLSSNAEQSSRVGFNINLTLNKSIFEYIKSVSPEIKEEIPPVAGETSPTDNTGLNNGNKSSEKLITSFHILEPETMGNIDEIKYTVDLIVPDGTDLQNLTPSIVTSTGATVLPASHDSQDFTKPVIYTVTAQDGSVQVYKVVVNVMPKTAEQNNQSKWIIWAIVILVIFIFVIIAGGAWFIWRRRRSIK